MRGVKRFKRREKMITKIRKRDGRYNNINPGKITEAINKAALAVGDSIENYEGLSEKVMVDLNSRFVGKIPKVEDVQDTVEKVLIEDGHVAAAKEYILYRAERTRQREMNTGLMKTYEDLTFSDSDDSDMKRENANIDGNTSMGTMLKYGSEGAKQFNHLYLLDKDASDAHKSGEIHI